MSINGESYLEGVISDLTALEERYCGGRPLEVPSAEATKGIMEQFRALLFPGFFGSHSRKGAPHPFCIGHKLYELVEKLALQVRNGLCFQCAEDNDPDCGFCEEKAMEIAVQFIKSLPSIKEKLEKDVEATCKGDPAAKSRTEIIACYPGIRAITNYRIAHQLHHLNVPLLPRMITELAHAETGIDIHPEVEIGHSFVIDHGTAIVIGQTCIIGNHVKMYQGVTLGARSFPVDSDGVPVKGMARHPVVEDHVVIYAGATILGRVTVGEHSVIGGNVWLTRNVSAHSRIVQRRPL